MKTIPLLLLLALSACGDRPVSQAKAYELWGTPCRTDTIGATTETWTYCVVPCGTDGSLCDAHCSSDCEFWKRLTISDGYVVAMDFSPSLLDGGYR
jgi:hypothetical protein